MDWQKHQNSGWLPSGLPIIGLAAVVSIIGMSYGAITFRQLALNAQLFHPDFYGIFGLLAIKPQTAVLIPCALLGIGSWRAFVSAALTVTTLILLSGALFSYHLWLTFLDNLPTYQSAMMHNTKIKSLMTTIEAASEVLGVPNTVAVFFQAGASITVGAIIYLCSENAATYRR